MAASLAGLCPHYQRPAALAQRLHHLPQRRGEQQRLLLDQVWVNCPDGIQVRALARCLGRAAPAVLNR